MAKEVKGSFTKLDGQQFYKIENYDHMEDFFMTITSSSDVWNFCWSQGGITAGRINSDHAIFPYYTADKVSESKINTGSYTAISVKEDGKTVIWEPFAPLMCNTGYKFVNDENIQRNIYKNVNGTKIWFEEINKSLQLAFRYGWTSSAEYGLVKMSRIENLSDKKRNLVILDGTRNIIPASVDSNLQLTSSELLDAYKQTDIDKKANIGLFALSAVLSDKAEPSESLLSNVSWFTTKDPIVLSPSAPQEFFESDGNEVKPVECLRGGKPSCYIVHKSELASAGSNTSFDKWYEVFDTTFDHTKIVALENKIIDRDVALANLEKDIEATDFLMTSYINESDGIQNTAATMTCVHHRANVMFNIMRGGFFADNGKINAPDLIKFISVRNKDKVEEAKKALGEYADKNSVSKDILEEKILASKDPQLQRLFLEYMPIIFSRRHGDPSRPWNRFNIKLNDSNGNPILNYEGNWRDIFQNWEALAVSYPAYIKNMCAKFLNAMTADGFNPYRITREGIDWETPEPDNPWAQYGYWGDHQVIYFEKLIELWNKTERKDLLESLNDILYTSSNIPYRIKSYEQVRKDPRSSILFDKALSDRLIKESRENGTDRKLIQGEGNQPALVSLTAKILQIIIAKASNLVPGGGIWMNTQRPEWNDANNALAGYGLSVVTLCYLHRMIKFLIEVYSASAIASYTLPKKEAQTFKALAALYADKAAFDGIKDAKARKTFTDKAGLLFEEERNEFYANGYKGGTSELSKEEIVSALKDIQALVKESILVNKRADGLYHTYNTMIITDSEMQIKTLNEMLEGQVAVLSSGLLNSAQTLELVKALKTSDIFEKRQYSYILYPNKKLPAFMDKNNVTENEVKGLKDFIKRSENKVLIKDANGVYHFAPSFNNARLMQEYIEKLPESQKPTSNELTELLKLYEDTFKHQNFTGRSGTFYAYEGLGSIYWHMCSKLLLAVQEHALEAFENGDKEAKELEDAYYDVRKGLSFNKTPEIYGAFPSDPYSHTPFGKGARQPGMTGQVKEEVLTRWGELGVSIVDGKAQIKPEILKKDEFFEDGSLSFTWCGVAVSYHLASSPKITVEFADGQKKTFEGCQMDEETTKELFARNGKIKNISAEVVL